MTVLKLKKSSESGKVPTSSDLDYGEVAINYADGRLYYKNHENSINAFYSGPPGTKFIKSDTAPTEGIQDGDRWLDTNSGIEYTWFVDGDSGQWVEVGPGGSGAKGDDAGEGTVIRLIWDGTAYPGKKGIEGALYDFVGPVDPGDLLSDGDTWKVVDV